MSAISSLLNKASVAAGSAGIAVPGAADIAKAALENITHPTSGISATEDAADAMPEAEKVASRAEGDAVGLALCAHLDRLFSENMNKFGDMMESRVKAHMDEGAVATRIKDMVCASVAPKVEAALSAAIEKMRADGIYEGLLKKNIDAVLDADIRKAVFDNLNSLSTDVRRELLRVAIPKEIDTVKTALTPVAPVMAQTAPAKGGASRRRRARGRRSAALRGGATRRRQRVLVLA